MDCLNIQVSREIKNNNRTIMEDLMNIVDGRKEVENILGDLHLEKKV